MSIFLTADLHLGHANILGLCARPFASIEEMNEVLVEYWNAAVCPEDLVYVLGDFAWWKCGSVEYADFRRSLNGTIRLVRGNHDKRVPEGLFDTVKDLDRIVIPGGGGQHIELCHYAMRSWCGSFHGSYHCFGHSHGRLPPYGKSFDVGVDAHDYRPWSLEEVIEKMKSLPDSRQKD